MSVITILSEEASWRSRDVRYYEGDWASIQTVIPEFYLAAFAAGEEDPANPFLQTVMRKPMSAVERPIPIGVVSHTYSLAQHREVAEICRQGLKNARIKLDGLRYQLGLSELGEWMNFRVYFPTDYDFIDDRGNVRLRLECFNSVDGSSRLMIVFGWLRFVCSNGLVIGESKIEIRERHGQNLDLGSIAERIRPALAAVAADRARMEKWQGEKIVIDGIKTWADEKLSEKWGKKAAARVFHICDAGKDIEFEDPFAPGAATEKPFRFLGPVPGAPERAATKYDVAQALSFVATNRKNAEERVAWQADVPHLLQSLAPIHSTSVSAQLRG
ncbi:DUF932 domain-containing protein [Methylocystis sp.]|uniref:DUF932 domain-containing protein n=1 Tax=Methylocystis sp. TaxID=1911079 RepID=UPI0025F2A02E|nr:DUF932 domain-containing protein [Methylocystis sp.]